jgi:peptidoglycan hydrolase CwlO-like protein
MQLIQDYLPAIITAVGALFTGGWFLWARKKGSMSAELAKNEFTNVDSMVDDYLETVGRLSKKITTLTSTIVDLESKQMQLEQENNKLKDEIAELKKLKDEG